MLAILSALSALNQAICYSYAPIDSIVEARWQERLHSEHLITIYFVSYIPCSFIGSWIMDKFVFATSVAINANAMGTAIVYLTAPFVVLSSDEVPFYNFCMAVEGEHKRYAHESKIISPHNEHEEVHEAQT
ncbi:hypothetical protein AM588_10004138 [Phytophthora nicotianae]|uniref:Uncharacterized protein n=1 Tax=Phytophthora nicotianae TaxID=4792 RepID=A0A0W8CUC7_PHYNI|nr:hypothetical protein AM588_10004138 [Phytophthora nicotianae]